MPIYEYACKECGKEFDLLVASERLADSQLCPYCGTERLERKFSTFASISSGSGSCPAPSGSCGKYS